MKKIDVLIVGQGLAGTILQDYLIKSGLTSIIVDKYREVTSSKVAAGIMNPITGRRFAKTWLAEELFPQAVDYYQDQGNISNEQFYYPLPVHRYLGSIEDQNTWMGRSADDSIQQFVGDKNVEVPLQINAEFGGAEIIGGGYVDTKMFLELKRIQFLKESKLLDAQINFDDLEVTDNKIIWNDLEADKIVFCEGFRAIQNNLFSWLPFTFAKGEIFDLKIPDLPQDRIYNRNGFIMPRANGTFKMGATYRWNEMDEESTERSKIELTEKLEKIINCNYEILDQKASIRPTVKDRRPFIGNHPKHKNIFIFNGFGSKGVTLIPFFANHFTNVLNQKSTLMSEVNIERYYPIFNDEKK